MKQTSANMYASNFHWFFIASERARQFGQASEAISPPPSSPSTSIASASNAYSCVANARTIRTADTCVVVVVVDVVVDVGVVVLLRELTSVTIDSRANEWSQVNTTGVVVCCVNTKQYQTILIIIIINDHEQKRTAIDRMNASIQIAIHIATSLVRILFIFKKMKKYKIKYFSILFCSTSSFSALPCNAYL